MIHPGEEITPGSDYTDIRYQTPDTRYQKIGGDANHCNMLQSMFMIVVIRAPVLLCAITIAQCPATEKVVQ